MTSFYVYAYYEKRVADPFYVGKGHGNRAFEHLEECNRRKRTLFYDKLRTLVNDDIEIAFLETELSESEALSREMDFIAYFGRRNLRTGCLLNLTDGGEGQSGRIVSPATRALISKSNLGVKRLSLRKPIVAFWCSMIVKEYDFIDQVREDGYTPNVVRHVLKGERPSAYGFQWKYKE